MNINIIKMKKALVIILLSVLTASSPLIWIAKTNARSGSTQLTMPLKPSYQSFQLISFTITYLKQFQSGSAPSIKITLGLSGISNFPLYFDDQRQWQISYTAANLHSFNISIKSSYHGEKWFHINYLSIMDLQKQFIIYSNRIQQNECRINTNGVVDQSCNHSTANGYECRVCSKNVDLPGIQSSFKSNIMIIGFGFTNIDDFYIRMVVNSINTGQFQWNLQWARHQMDITFVSFNAIFINETLMTPENTQLVSIQSTININSALIQNLIKTPNTYLIGFNSLYLGTEVNIILYWSLNSFFQTISNGTKNPVIIYNIIIMRSKCNQSCYSCHKNHTCILCDNTYYQSHRQCNCSLGQGMNTVNSMCQCHYSCKQCNLKNNPNACTSCDSQLNRSLNTSTSSCICHRGYTECNDSSLCFPSICYPSDQYPISINNITKTQNKNKFSFYVKIHRLEPEFDIINFMDVMDFILPYGCQYSLEYQGNGTIFVDVIYTEDLTSQQITVVLNIRRVNNLRPEFKKFVMLESSSATSKLEFQNGLLLFAYPEKIYDQMKIISYSIYVILGAALFNVVLALVDRSKVTASQMVGVLQLSYFGMIISGTYRSPLMIPMAELKYSNGYNLQIKSLYPVENPINFALTKISTSIPDNVNIMCSVVILPIIVTGICYIISLIHIRKRVIYQKAIKLIICEYMLTCLIFLSFDLSFSFAAFLMYRNTTFLSAILGYCEFGIFMVLIIIQLVFFVKKDYMYFGEYKYSMKTDTFSINYYYLIPILQRIIMGGVLGALNNSFISGAAVMVILAGQIVVIIVKKPYSDRFHNQRAIANNTIGILIMGVYIGLNFKGNTNSFMVIYAPFIVIGLNLICVCMSLVFTLKRTIVNIVNYLNEQMQTISNQDKGEKADQQLFQMFESHKKQQKQNPIHKMMINKMVEKKKKKKSKRISNILILNEEENVNEQNSDQLNVARVLKVDQMLRQGLV